MEQSYGSCFILNVSLQKHKIPKFDILLKVFRLNFYEYRFESACIYLEMTYLKRNKFHCAFKYRLSTKSNKVSIQGFQCKKWNSVAMESFLII